MPTSSESHLAFIFCHVEIIHNYILIFKINFQFLVLSFLLSNFFLGCAGSHCRVVISPVAESRGYSPFQRAGFSLLWFSCCRAAALGARASAVAAPGSRAQLRSCGARAQSLCSTWDLPEPGIEPVSPALAGGFFTTEPAGKPKPSYFKWNQTTTCISLNKLRNIKIRLPLSLRDLFYKHVLRLLWAILHSSFRGRKGDHDSVSNFGELPEPYFLILNSKTLPSKLPISFISPAILIIDRINLMYQFSVLFSLPSRERESE